MSDWARWINTGRQLASALQASAATAKGGQLHVAPREDRHPVSVAAELTAAVANPRAAAVVGKVAAVSPEPAAASTVGALHPGAPSPTPDAAPTVPCHYTESRVHTVCLARGCIYPGPHCHHCGAPIVNGAAA